MDQRHHNDRLHQTIVEGWSPSPARDDGGCHKPRLDGSSSCRESFRSLKLAIVSLESPSGKYHAECCRTHSVRLGRPLRIEILTKSSTQTENDAIAEALGQNGGDHI
jgi:hypothetical protein